MSARHKLNIAALNGALLIAGVAGIATGSLGVFAVLATVLVGSGLYLGEIRPGGKRRS